MCAVHMHMCVPIYPHRFVLHIRRRRAVAARRTTNSIPHPPLSPNTCSHLGVATGDLVNLSACMQSGSNHAIYSCVRFSLVRSLNAHIYTYGSMAGSSRAALSARVSL